MRSGRGGWGCGGLGGVDMKMRDWRRGALKGELHSQN